MSANIQLNNKSAKCSTTCEERNPEKDFMKFLCKILYVFGLGNYWHEDNSQTRTKRVLYTIWTVVFHFYVTSVMFDVGLNLFLRDDLTIEERNYVIQCLIGEITVYFKFVFLILQRQRIKDFFAKMFGGTRAVYVDIDEAAVKKTKFYIYVLASTEAISVLTAAFEAVRAHYNTGIKVRIIITYWPKDSSSGFMNDVFRIITQLHWPLCSPIIAIVDGICIGSIVILAHRFIALRRYYDRICEGTTGKTKTELEEEMMKRLVVGVRLHEDTLWLYIIHLCAQSLRYALGNMYSLQVVQSIALLAICLVKLVITERSLTFLVANFSYIQYLIAVTAIYMIAAGDTTYEVFMYCLYLVVYKFILPGFFSTKNDTGFFHIYPCHQTEYQASLLDTAMFHCGWEQWGLKANFRRILTVAMQRSQVPVVMTAFGIFNLSYSTLITILRASYSFFAVMY